MTDVANFFLANFRGIQSSFLAHLGSFVGLSAGARRHDPAGRALIEQVARASEALVLFISDAVACLNATGDIVTVTASQACYGVTYSVSK